MAGLLKGVRVLESAQLLTGDYTGQILADEGADVVKVESPFRGDYLRDILGQIKPHKRGHSPLHMVLNRNKRSVTVNLREEVGREIFWRMFEEADVFLDGNMHGVLDKLGVGYASQRERRPEIVYVSVSGYGCTGPYSSVPTHGHSMSSLAAGNPYEIGPDGVPTPTTDPNKTLNAPNPTVVGPLYAAMAVCAGLYRRERTGRGAHIDVGASDAAISSAWMSVVNCLNADRIQADLSGALNANGRYGFFATKDNKVILSALIEHHFWENFCRAIDREDLLAEGVGYQTKEIEIDWGPEAIRPVLVEIFRTRTLAEWMDIAARHDCALAPAHTAQDAAADAHLRARETFIQHDHPTAGPLWVTGNPVKVEGEQFEVTYPAPSLGQHTNEFLSSMGYDAATLDAWRSEGII